MNKTILISSDDHEFLQTALQKGWLNGQAQVSAQAVMTENTSLRHENAILKGRLAEQRRVNKTYRETHLAALKYQFEVERGYKLQRPYRWSVWFAVIGVTIALYSLLQALVIYYA